MAKRQTKRKVTIRLVGRDPNDPLTLFVAIEDAFRPGSIEVVCERPEAVAEPLVVLDESLETQAREQAAEVLDEKDRQSKASPTPDARGPAESSPTKMKSFQSWLTRKNAAGWRIVVKNLPVAGQVAGLAKAVKDIFFG
jgi:hypothetical protein